MAYATPALRNPEHLPMSITDGGTFNKADSIGATGHWIKTAGILAPLLIGEFVKDAYQRSPEIKRAA